MPSLQELLASPINVQAGETLEMYRSQLNDLQQASMQTRNETMGRLFKQYDTPMTNVYEAGGADQLARQLREGRMSRAEGLQQRGLASSGAASLSERSLRDLYSRGMLDNVMNANQSEQNRKLSLMQQLLGLNQSDLEFNQGFADAALTGTQANFSEKINQLAMQLGGAHMAGIAVAILGGGIAGAAGGAGAGSTLSTAAGGLTGVGGGALGGLAISNQLWPSGGPSNLSAGMGFQPSQAASASQYGGKPIATNPSAYNESISPVTNWAINNTPEFTALMQHARNQFGG